MRWFTIILILSLFIGNSCKSSKKEFVSTIKPMPLSQLTAPQTKTSPCNERSNYIPDADHIDHTPVRKVKVNFHFMRDSKGQGNFDEETGVKSISEYIYSANGNLQKNAPMNLPEGNNTEVLPQLYQYVLTPDPSIPGDDGIYFHDDDDFYFILNKGRDKNNYSKAVFEKYGIQKGEVLNVFIQDNHLDSLKSSTYKQHMNGIAFGTWVKCSMWYSNYSSKSRKWLAPKQLNHEIGHVLGLLHTWRGRDGCDDTPPNPNCWGKNGRAECETPSNNVMDYNPNRNAWTPCQLGIVHHALTQNTRKRNLLVRTWCELKENKTIFINEKIEWNSCKDLEGHIVVEDGGELTIRCRVSLPQKAKITVAPTGKLILDGARLHNDCGDTWQGIEVWKKGGKKGAVVYTNDATIENVEHSVEFIAEE